MKCMNFFSELLTELKALPIIGISFDHEFTSSDNFDAGNSSIYILTITYIKPVNVPEGTENIPLYAGTITRSMDISAAIGFNDTDRLILCKNICCEIHDAMYEGDVEIMGDMCLYANEVMQEGVSRKKITS